MLELKQILIFLGTFLVLSGVLYLVQSKFRLGELPGDFNIDHDKFSLSIPIATTVLMSIVLTGMYWLASQF